jgi:hypothetical protein
VTDPSQYLFAGDHPEPLASGRTLLPGDTVPADAVNPDDAHDRYLLDEGRLRPVEDAEPLTGDALKQRAAELDIDGRSQMNAAQLRDAVAQAEQAQATDNREEA